MIETDITMLMKEVLQKIHSKYDLLQQELDDVTNGLNNAGLELVRLDKCVIDASVGFTCDYHGNTNESICGKCWSNYFKDKV